jgi:hypothetical protein
MFHLLEVRALVLCTGLLVFGCNNVPINTLDESFSLKVTKSEENSESVKVDFLWVIDDSASMCQEQASLAESFDEFINRVENFVNIDYRIAVVTTDMLSEDRVGKFRHHRTDAFPFACKQEEVYYCVEDANGDKLCEDQFGPDFVCTAPNSVKQITNCNGTINSRCQKLCAADADCDASLISAEQGASCASDPSTCRFKCNNPSGDPQNTGCVLKPDTQDCPTSDELRQLLIDGAGKVCENGDSCEFDNDCSDNSRCLQPAYPFLTRSTASTYFKCIGVVGAEQRSEANLEQGLNAALYALDPTEERANADQAKSFLRDDAYLVIVFVSDEDDCSTARCDDQDPDDPFFRCGWDLPKEQFGRCTCLSDTTKGGPLRPVTEAVNRIKSIKSDPGRVLVAAIIGDSLETEETAITEDRDLYLASKCSQCPNPQDQHPQLFNTYICNSFAGKADLGKRYIDFVQGFGQNGILTNICSDSGVGPALQTIADRIVRVFTRVCLPKPILDESTLVVQLLGPEGKCSNGSDCCVPAAGVACQYSKTCEDQSVCVPNVSDPLLPGTEQDTNTYKLEVSSDCEETAGRKAIFFNSLLPPGTDLRIDYEAETDL